MANNEMNIPRKGALGNVEKMCYFFSFFLPYFKVLAIFVTLLLRAVITRYNAFVRMFVERVRRKIERKDRLKYNLTSPRMSCNSVDDQTSVDHGCVEPFVRLWEHSASYKTDPALWTSQSRQGDRHVNGTFQLVVIKAKQTCGNCAGAREGSGTPAWESQGHFPEKVRWSCPEGWERVAGWEGLGLG